MVKLEELEGGEIGTHLDLVRAVRDIFKKDGYLKEGLGLEYRAGQSRMAEAIAEAFEGNESLLFEAPTGVGKSLAYLIPGIIRGINENRPFIVSTHTKALQGQILGSDLELCRKLFGSSSEFFAYEHFSTAMLMGRNNYLCTTRLAHAIQTKGDLFASPQQEELERIAQWAAETEEGIVEELSPAPLHEVWEWVSADSSTCCKKNCNGNDCFFQKAKKRLRAADVIVMNHSLLFSLLNTGMSSAEGVPGILLPQDFVVIDEAHTIGDIATDHFGVHVSSYGLDRTLKMLYNPKKNRGLLSRINQKQLNYIVVECIAAAEEFFNLIRQQYLQKGDCVRIREASWVEAVIVKPLAILIDKLAAAQQEVSSENDRDNLRDLRSSLQVNFKNILNVLALEPKDHVHWVEKSGKAGQNVVIRSAPVNIAPYLKEALFEKETSVILTSATLATDGTLENFKSKIGAQGEREEIEESPFDFEKQVEIDIVEDAPFPEPGKNEIFRDYLGRGIMKSMEGKSGGTLVLFTNFSDMYGVAEKVRGEIESMGKLFLVQGSEMSRNKLIEVFKADGNGVLFGTDSFWTGVDIPGEALSHLIITKLPFENPSHPVKEAQYEAIKVRGGVPFMELTIPEAVLKFRQGLGRLIRKSTDRGVITILDSRIINKPYGKHFLKVLPKMDFRKVAYN